MTRQFCFAFFQSILLSVFSFPVIVSAIPLAHLASSPGTSVDSTIIDNERYQVGKYYDRASETWYFLTRINHTDKEGKLIKLRLALSNTASGEAVREFALREGCMLAFNASTAHNTRSSSGKMVARRPTGIQIVDGKIIQDRVSGVYTLGIKDNNKLLSYNPGTTARDILNDDTKTALTAFIPLIEEHRIVSDSLFSLRSNFNKKNPRQIIAQFDNLDLLFLSCGGRGFDGEGMTAKDVIRILGEKKVRLAFMLDGGGSVSTVIEGKLITRKIDKHGTEERLRPNFLYVK